MSSNLETSRLNFDAKLRSILGNSNTYFQPPENVKIDYPAIIYSLDGLDTDHADNLWYRFGYRFEVQHIHSDPDVEIMNSMRTKFIYSRFDRRFVSDNLYHDVYTIYYK